MLAWLTLALVQEKQTFYQCSAKAKLLDTLNIYRVYKDLADMCWGGGGVIPAVRTPTSGNLPSSCKLSSKNNLRYR